MAVLNERRRLRPRVRLVADDEFKMTQDFVLAEPTTGDPEMDEPRSDHSCVMLLDSQFATRSQLADILDDPGVIVTSTTDWKVARQALVNRQANLVICDVDLPDRGAEHLFRSLEETHPNCLRRLLLSRSEFSQTEFMFGGSSLRRDVLHKPFRHDQVLASVVRRLGQFRSDAAYG